MTTMLCDTVIPTPDGCFYYLNNPSCEGVDWGIHFTSNGHPGLFEPVNTVSNIFFLLAGGYALFNSIDTLTQFSSIVLMLVGIGSALFHATMWQGFNNMDSFAQCFVVLMLAMTMAYKLFQHWLVFFAGLFYLCYIVFTRKWPTAANCKSCMY